ncbi:hypothetical protein O181_079900 [Austropuccinia psidii MF-1]|uniref:Uncharacterized protein n=1 Tax=Austropuccinia psidii MF-1 TaxID=1389203 RepID=A0A9Q3FM94_9BASI|nr:hypothetical protein [Austropuccinia psidii MF-1]
MPICKPQALGWQTGPPGGMNLCNIAKLVRKKAKKKSQDEKGDNTMMKLTYKTKELSISPKSGEFGHDLQNKNGQTTSKDSLKTQPLKMNHPIYVPSQLTIVKKPSKFCGWK